MERKAVKLKAASQEERLLKWKEPFKNLLGNPTEIINKPTVKKISITLIAAKVYNALLLNHIQFEVKRKFIGKIRTVFREILPCHRFWLSIIEGVCAKNFEATQLFINFSKAFDSIYRGKMEQILVIYGFPKETVTAIIEAHPMVTDFFDIVIGVLKADILVPYVFIIRLDYVLWISVDLIKENSFAWKKTRIRWYANYPDYLALLANTTA